jgi:hypothetical protein
MMASSYPSLLLLGRLAAPPVVITNPDLIKYLIFQLFSEATLVVTLVVLSAMALREEWMHAMRLWKRWKGRMEEPRKEAVGEAYRAAGEEGVE